MRRCLRCKNVFYNKSKYNFLCKDCNEYNSKHGFYLQDIMIAAGDKKMEDVLTNTRGRLVST